jgi:hypothetical protein
VNFERPRYRWNSQRGMYTIMTSEITKPENASVPAWMRKASTGASFGNIDASDLKPPRLMVLAGQSPAVMNGTPGAVPGNFWISILNLNLGQQVTGTPILLRKTYQLWAPKAPGSDQKGPLASASDGIHWDQPNQTFEVKFPGNPKIYKWVIKKTVFENRMDKFGSSQDDDPGSKPAATKTYDVLWLIDLPNGQKQLCVFTNARTGVTPTQNFISTTRTIGVDQFFQRYRIVVQRKTGPTGDPYFTYEYQYVGTFGEEEEELGKFTRSIYDQYSKSGFVTDFEGEADDINTERRTEGSKRDFADKMDDGEEIPF